MITGCASQSSSMKKDPELIAAKEQISKLEEKIIELETRFGALNEKFNLLNSDKPDASPATKTETVKVQPVAAAKNATIPAPATEHGKFADSFHHNEATDRYREAKILFETQKYSDAILEFGEFLKNHPRHALASNAQLHIGLSYFHQKEYKIAEEELTRVLIDHPHSNAIPDTLAALMKTSSELGNPARVAYFREKLNAFFANSPQSQVTIPEQSEKPSSSESKSVEKPSTPQPPTAPVPEMNSADLNGQQPSVVKQ
jgi:TolA-binding protein